MLTAGKLVELGHTAFSQPLASLIATWVFHEWTIACLDAAPSFLGACVSIPP